MRCGAGEHVAGELVVSTTTRASPKPWAAWLTLWPCVANAETALKLGGCGFVAHSERLQRLFTRLLINDAKAALELGGCGIVADPEHQEQVHHLLTWLLAGGAETALELGGCEFIAHLEALQRLSLERTLLGHAQLCALAQLTRLTSLNLAWCGPACATFSSILRVFRASYWGGFRIAFRVSLGLFLGFRTALWPPGCVQNRCAVYMRCPHMAGSQLAAAGCPCRALVAHACSADGVFTGLKRSSRAASMQHASSPFVRLPQPPAEAAAGSMRNRHSGWP